MPPCSLINKAMKFDEAARLKKSEASYNDEQVQLAAAWMEGIITTDAVASVLGCDKSNASRRCVVALRQALSSGRVGFTWQSPDSIGGSKPFSKKDVGRGKQC